MDRKKKDKEFEALEAVGSDDEKTGRKATQEVMQAQERETQKELATDIATLGDSRSTFLTYNMAVAKLLEKRLRYNDWPQGWSFKVRPDNIGVVMEVYGGGKVFRLALKPVGIPTYDLHAVDVFANRAQTTVDHGSTSPFIT